jgi:hypothetical protein
MRNFRVPVYRRLLVDRRSEASAEPSTAGVIKMNDINTRICLNMARCLDAEAERTRDDSYLQKLLKEQAAKYRTDAASE